MAKRKELNWTITVINKASEQAIINYNNELRRILVDEYKPPRHDGTNK